ncbi:MAG: S-layer homology domain-containing protein [Butyricicoccus pullicaecorum]|nr:S-layer homology domain-containing protein [Butyricicoccus pullicaecorum]
MNKIQQRAISGILSFSMIVSTMPSAFARNESISGTAEISFAASKYVVSENEKKLKVKIVRSGGNDSKVDIAFKAADFTAEYGVDYVVLDENGDELPVADGIVPDESMFEEISNNAITTEVDENAAATDNQTIEESEQSNQNAEDDTTAGEIINDEGKVEKLPSVIEDISDAKPQERIDDAEKQSTDKLESEDDSTAADEQTDEKSEQPSESTDTTTDENSGNAGVDNESQEPDENTGDDTAEDNENSDNAGADTESQKPEENNPDAEKQDEVSDAVEDEPALGAQEAVRTSTGSALLDAQAQYLQLPDEDGETAEAVENILTETNKYFQSARGAMGVVTFQKGQTQKEITIKIIDNDRAHADKIIMLSLMGVNGDEKTSLAANPTAYVNIMDDEAYEKPVITPDINEITLTEQESSYELTLTRTEGVEYYTSVLVSTVKGTAQEGYHYEKMEDASLAFVPGETEKKLKISAEHFDKEMTFGIRLESDGTCEITDEYITVTMAAKPSQNTAIDGETDALMSVNGDVERAESKVLGHSNTKIDLDTLGMEKGPSTGSQDGWHRTNSSSRWTDYGLYETYKNSGRTWVSKHAFNFSGVNKVSFWHQNKGDYIGNHGVYHIFIELLREKDRYNYGASSDKSLRKDGNHDWTNSEMDVSGLNGDYFIRFGIRNGGWPGDNAQGWFGNPISFEWQKYNFNIHNKQVFNRLEYDYADKTGEALKIAYTDGQDDYDYTPSVKLVDNAGNEVSGFYANANQTIKPVSTNPQLDAKYGIELEGVYLYTKDNDSLYRKETKYPYKDNWYTDKTLWIPASGTSANQSLAERIDKTFGRNVTIKVMPKFKQKTITLHIHNTDDENTYIANMNSKQAESYRDWGSRGYYNKYTFPMNSKIKVRAVAAQNKTLTGFMIDIWSKSDHVIYSDSNTPERMTYVLSENMSFYPRTENDGMNVAYMPNADKVVDDLTGRAFLQPSTAQKAEEMLASNKNGDIHIKTVYPGMLWTLRATAPDGYYVKWTNGTGDIKNVNGMIDASSDPNINEQTESTKKFQNLYNPIFGDILSRDIVQSNTKYYYEFVKNNNTPTIVKGRVERENGSFYEVVHNRQLDVTPVKAAQVSIAGTAGFTDETGHFAIEVKNVPRSGMVSILVDDNGTAYPATALINNLYLTLPAYECFKPKALSIRYADDVTNKINGTAVNVKDDTLHITAEVESNGTIEPVGAKFSIHKVNGTTIDCSEDARFTNSFANRTATISFNPKAVLDSGDRIYVSFTDQNGKSYKSIDLGYDFVTPLNLRTFLFPLIGSELLEDTYSSAVELIGDPLGNVSLGKIGFDEPVTEDVTPPGMDSNKYKYQMTTYQFGDYKSAVKTFGAESEEEPDQSKSEETKQNAKKALDKNGQKPDGGGYKTAKSFSWELSPKMVFAMQLTSRNVDGEYKYFFEELDFIVGFDFDVDGKITITLPIGMNVIITAGLNGNITGIFQLKTDYTGDSTWNTNKVEYSPDTFGLFEEIEHVNRKAYLMLDPNISLGLGVEIAIIELGGHANFNFDMDFEFGLNAGSLGHRMYGDMTYNFDYYIKVLSFEVYSNATKEQTVKLFSENADGHIEPDLIPDLLSAEDDRIQSVQTTRDYLANESRWNGRNDSISLLDIDAGNTEEMTLQSGIYPSAKTTLTPIGDGKMFMTFIGDVPSRGDVDRTGLFYSIYDGTTWSQPKLVDDDGTLDDYPNVFDLGDKLLISWSSADQKFENNATTQQALSALDIKTVFFDKQSERFEQVTQLTHKTQQDIAADVEPKAAYDSTSDRLILYYTKTEYEDAKTLTDLTTAASVIAYRFYENGKWNDESSYTDKELEGVVDKDAYKSNWYGQRFLDTRIDKTSQEMLRIIDSDAISYNGLALYAWTVDYDKDLNTVEDRDVFMQIYNFKQNDFTHIIKMTPEPGAYQTPKFGRYKDETFLFYSAVGKLGEGEGEEQSGIAYFEVSDIISNNKYTKVQEGSSEYYKLEYKTTVQETTSNDGTVIPAAEQTIKIMPSYAVKLDGYVNNYSVDVDQNESMYLTWTNSDENGSRQVYTSIFDCNPSTGTKAADKNSRNSDWSEAFKLTNAEDVSYRNADAAVMNGKLYVVSSKTPYITDGDSKKLDDNDTSLVMLTHTPYSKAVTVDENALAVNTEYVYPNTGFVLTSTVKNEGTRFIDKPVTFRFTMVSNGTVTELGTQTVEGVWGAGKTLQASVNVPAIAEIRDDLTFCADITVEGGTPIRQEMRVVKEYNLVSDGDASLIENTDGHALYIPIRNKGNVASPEVTVTLYTAKQNIVDTFIDTYTVNSIAENTSVAIEEVVQIPDSAFAIDGDDGAADIIAVVRTGGEDIITLEATAHKNFDAQAIETMRKVTNVSLKGSDRIYAKRFEDIEIGTEIEGTAGDEVTVIWKTDNSDVVYIREDNTLFAAGNGTARLTGYVVPSTQNIVFRYDGTLEHGDVLKTIPSTLYHTVVVDVIVNETGTGSGGGSSGSDSDDSDDDSDKEEPKKEEELNEPTTPSTGTWSNPFSDVSSNDWFFDSVRYVCENNIFKGMTDTSFEPHAKLTRAMLVTVLYRLERDLDINRISNNSFTDVAAESWYGDAVYWASLNGIVKGYSEGTFAPNDQITREQFAAIMERYAVYKGDKESKSVDMSQFTDIGEISDWATTSLSWAVGSGLISGKGNGILDPKGSATRAEAAAILQRYIENISKSGIIQ